jgi:proline racemase
MLHGDSDMPAVLKELPETGRKKNEETYIKESVLGHEFLTGAFKALYEVGDTPFSLFLFKKGSGSDALKTVSDYLKSAGLEVDDPSVGKYVFKDGYNGDIFLSWKDNTIVVISGLSKDQTDLAGRYSTEILK